MVSMGSPKAKTRGASGPKDFGRETSRGTPFTMMPLRLFHTFLFFCHPELVKRDFFWPMDSLGSIMVNIQGMDFQYWLNHNILVRHVERMENGSCKQFPFISSMTVY